MGRTGTWADHLEDEGGSITQGTGGVHSPARGVDATILQAQQGDMEAFERLYREHADRVYAVCLRMSADTALATELLQDVFVRVWKKLGTFRGESAFSTWLHRLAVNVVLGERRKATRRWQREETTDDPAKFASVVVPSRPSTELQLDLEHAIGHLPTAARGVFVLHDIEGYRHAEIAEQLGIAVGTSKAHLHRARRQLREALAP